MCERGMSTLSDASHSCNADCFRGLLPEYTGSPACRSNAYLIRCQVFCSAELISILAGS